MAEHDEEALLREELDLDYEVDEELPEEELLGDDEEFVLSGEEHFAPDRSSGKNESVVQNEHEEDVLDLGVTDSALDELDDDSFRSAHRVQHDKDEYAESTDERQEHRDRFRTERPNNSGHKPIVFNEIESENGVPEADRNNSRKFTAMNKLRGNNNRGRGRNGQFKIWQNRGNFQTNVYNNRGGMIHSRLGQRFNPGPQHVNIPPLESKKVLINPHFRGNVQPSQDARLVWDQGVPNMAQPFHHFNNNGSFLPNNLTNPPFQQQHHQQPQQPQQLVPPPLHHQMGFNNHGSWNPPAQSNNFMQTVDQNFNHNPHNPQVHLPIPVVTIQNVQPQQDVFRNEMPQQFESVNQQQLGPMLMNNAELVQSSPQFQPHQQQQNFEYPTQSEWYNTDHENVSNVTYTSQSEQFFKIPTQSGFRGRGHHRGGARFTNPINQYTLRAIPTDIQTQGPVNRGGGRATFHNRANRGNKFPRQPAYNYRPQGSFPPQQDVFLEPNTVVSNQNMPPLNNSGLNVPPQNNMFNPSQYVAMHQPQFQNQPQFNAVISSSDYNQTPYQSSPQVPQVQVNYQQNQIQNQNVPPNNFQTLHSQHQTPHPGPKSVFYDPNRQVKMSNQTPRVFTQRSPLKRAPPMTVNEATVKRKKSLEFRNLQEVPTVDVPDTTVFFEERNPSIVVVEEEDEETRSYRMKIEEQKKLRELVLKQKEERRKKAAAKADSIPSSTDTGLVIQKGSENASSSTPIARAIFVQNKKLLLQKKMQQQKMVTKPIPERTLVQLNSSAAPQNRARNPTHNDLPTQSSNVRNVIKPSERPVVVGPARGGEIMPNTVSSSQLNKPLVFTKRVVRAIPRQNILQTSDETSENDEVIDKNHLNSFLSTRTVVPKPLTNGTVASINKAQVPLLKTPTVRVSNLAASTTEIKLRKLCKGVGIVQSVQMTPNSGQATIRFKNVSHAHTFYKKYQRKMVDLSLIDIALVPGP